MASLRETLDYEPQELGFGTSGLRGLVTVMTDLECYLNTAGFLAYLRADGQIKPGDTVYLAGDLRDSTPRIMQAVARATKDGGYGLEYCGLVPTPALALRSTGRGPGIMVTGSHIPADRNGIKFYKPAGEVLKADEGAIKAAVAEVRAALYGADAEASPFGPDGLFKEAGSLPAQADDARAAYLVRFTEAFAGQPLAGKKVVYYQHSAVGRDLLVELFGALGAEVVPVGRSEKFIPIDSENVKTDDEAYFKQLSEENPGLFAILSTDGDSDRPFVIDEHGVFHRGDELGAVVAHWFKADFAAYPVSTNDAVDQWLEAQGVPIEHTKIGSPYVIVAMQAAQAAGKQRVMGWEVNGGFLIGAELDLNGHSLAPLATRDAALPMIVALVAAAEADKSVSAVFGELPKRFTQAGLIDNFPVEVSRTMVGRFAEDTAEVRQELAKYFTAEQGFGEITGLNSLDGVRIFFANGDIAHLRPSGNAPQLRMYSVAATQERANEIVKLALAEPDGIFRRMQKAIEGK